VGANVAAPFDAFVADARTILAVPGSKAETSMYGKFETLLDALFAAAGATGLHVTQQANADLTGIPDYRIDSGRELLGWVELKAVVGKKLTDLKGHDKSQKDRFVAGLPNLILTNGWQWELYQSGNRVARVLFDESLFAGPPSLLPVDKGDELADMIVLFVTHQLAPYDNISSAVTALATRAKALKMGLLELGASKAGAQLTDLRADFNALVYKNGQPFTWERFVDSYVQIAAFGALLWRLETGKHISLSHQVGIKSGLHPLLAQCLTILWLPQSQLPLLQPLLEELCRTINLIPASLFAAPKKSTKRKYVPDPIVHAYEPFFRTYDAAAREANGVYYTPVEIVQQIVSGADELLKTSLYRKDGILSADARFLDPATGTGTFLLGLANEIALEAGKAGLPTDQVVHEVLTARTSAFELFPGPYTIAHQRLETLLTTLGTPATSRLPIYLADTLAAPESGQLPISSFGTMGAEILEERERADQVKTGDALLVIVGNPPYERVRAGTGGWDVFAATLMQQVVDATPLDRRADLKSATDLYVAFWAGALWALRSPADRSATASNPRIDTSTNHGLVGFVTNRTWILGPSLVGLRSLVRAGAKEVWVYDLGGDSRGNIGARSFAGTDANVFGIQTGIAIAWVVFDRNWTGTTTVRYRRAFGSKVAKLTDMAKPFDPSAFAVVDGQDVFVPAVWPWPLDRAAPLEGLFMAGAYTGVQSARNSRPHTPWGTLPEEVYAETPATLRTPLVRHGTLGAWSELTPAQRREGWATAATKRQPRLQPPEPSDLTTKKVVQALYRPLDVRWLYDDPRWIDWYREDLHAVYAEGPVPTLVSMPRELGNGPVAMHTDMLMEQHVFRGQAGGKGVFPLWLPAGGEPDNGRRIVAGRRSNLTDDTLEWAHATFTASADPAQDAYDYMLAVLSAPSYAERFWTQMETGGPRVPLTSDAALAADLAELGGRVRAAWGRNAPTVPGLRWTGNGPGPLGAAEHVGSTIRFANSRAIEGVPLDAWTFQVSLWKVIPEWFAARRHWTATMSQAQEALRVIGAAILLADIANELEAAVGDLLGAVALAPASSETRRRDILARGDVLGRVTDGPVRVPVADVSVDIDCEYEGGRVYLWGALTTDATRPEGKYESFHDWSKPGAKSERGLAAQFVDAILARADAATAAGQTLLVFHYSRAEATHLRRILADDDRLLRLEDLMVDVLEVLRLDFFGAHGLGLKTVAPEFGAVWREAGATGEDTLDWVAAARRSGPDAEAAQAKLLRYNEDDTRAVLVVRHGISGTPAESE